MLGEVFTCHVLKVSHAAIARTLRVVSSNILEACTRYKVLSFRDALVGINRTITLVNVLITTERIRDEVRAIVHITTVSNTAWKIRRNLLVLAPTTQLRVYVACKLSTPSA